MDRATGPTLAAIGVVALMAIAQAAGVARRPEADEALARGLAGRLDRAAAEVGPWAAAPLALDPRDMAGAGIGGWSARTYRRADTGSSMVALIVAGPPGPISSHTPLACYAGAGYAAEGPAESIAVDPGAAGPRSTFWAATFARPASPLPVRCRIFWAWSAGGPWAAEAEPRLAHAGAPVLAKMYLIRDLPPDGRGPRVDDAEAVDFLRGFLPRIAPAMAQAVAPGPAAP